jgi:hypothetical protein
MERREFIKLGLGVLAGATALAASASAAPLPPIRTPQGAMAPHGDAPKSALVTKDEVDHLQPEQVHWRHRHWRRWHRRHWRRWHRRYWRRHHWHRRYW